MLSAPPCNDTMLLEWCLDSTRVPQIEYSITICSLKIVIKIEQKGEKVIATTRINSMDKSMGIEW